VDWKQLDDGIGDTLVSVDATSGVRFSATASRFASHTEAAIVTDRQSLLVDRVSIDTIKSVAGIGLSGDCRRE